MLKNKYQQIGMALYAWIVFCGLITYVPVFNNDIWRYRIQPILWLVVIYLLIRRIPRIHLIGPLRLVPMVYIIAFNAGAVWIAANLCGGLLQGFGKSPYNHTLGGVMTNILVIGSALVGREHIRSYLVHAFGRRKQQLVVVLVTLLMFIPTINYLQIGRMQDLESFTKIVAMQWLPELGNNAFATILVLYGGPWASIIYLGLVNGLEWLSPILPNLDWLAKGVIGCVVPLILMAITSSVYLKAAKVVKAYREKEEKLYQWLPSAVLSVLIIWFVVGVFPIYPSAIATGSMIPMIMPGDVILVQKLTNQEEVDALEVGDVIQFSRDTILITHRIIEILKNEEGRTVYRTKGDNNSVADGRLVLPTELKGTIAGVIPKIGWPTLLFKSRNVEDVPLEEVEF